MPIDHFFQALAEDQGARAISVTLSGTASDGTLGMKAIKAGGGVTFAREPGSAKYDGIRAVPSPPGVSISSLRLNTSPSNSRRSAGALRSGHYPSKK
jgi:chemotaxis response regulator CheB